MRDTPDLTPAEWKKRRADLARAIALDDQWRANHSKPLRAMHGIIVCPEAQVSFTRYSLAASWLTGRLSDHAAEKDIRRKANMNSKVRGRYWVRLPAPRTSHNHVLTGAESNKQEAA